MSEILCQLPSEWRKQLVKAICKYFDNQSELACADVTNCETVTTLSSFTINEGSVCITYKDEDKQEFTRCFSLDELYNDMLGEVDPKCITSQETWDAMTATEKIQAIIDYACTCEEITTTTTTTTTSTTTTTTEP